MAIKYKKGKTRGRGKVDKLGKERYTLCLEDWEWFPLAEAITRINMKTNKIRKTTRIINYWVLNLFKGDFFILQANEFDSKTP